MTVESAANMFRYGFSPGSARRDWRSCPSPPCDERGKRTEDDWQENVGRLAAADVNQRREQHYERQAEAGQRRQGRRNARRSGQNQARCTE